MTQFARIQQVCAVQTGLKLAAQLHRVQTCLLHVTLPKSTHSVLNGELPPLHVILAQVSKFFVVTRTRGDNNDNQQNDDTSDQT